MEQIMSQALETLDMAILTKIDDELKVQGGE